MCQLFPDMVSTSPPVPCPSIALFTWLDIIEPVPNTSNGDQEILANTVLLLRCLTHVSCMRSIHCFVRFFPTYLPTFRRLFRSLSIFLPLLQPSLPSLPFLSILLLHQHLPFLSLLLLYQSLTPYLHLNPNTASELYHMASHSLLRTTTLFPTMTTRSILRCLMHYCRC